MCGLVGFLYKQAPGEGALGEPILSMLDVLGSRGTDGTGVALYGPARPGVRVARVRLAGKDAPQVQVDRIIKSLSPLARLIAVDVQDDYVRLQLSSDAAAAELA